MKDERVTHKMRGSESLKGVNQEQIKGKKRCRHWIRQDQRLWVRELTLQENTKSDGQGFMTFQAARMQGEEPND